MNSAILFCAPCWIPSAVISTIPYAQGTMPLSQVLTGAPGRFARPCVPSGLIKCHSMIACSLATPSSECPDRCRSSHTARSSRRTRACSTTHHGHAMLQPCTGMAVYVYMHAHKPVATRLRHLDDMDADSTALTGWCYRIGSSPYNQNVEGTVV